MILMTCSVSLSLRSVSFSNIYESIILRYVAFLAATFVTTCETVVLTIFWYVISAYVENNLHNVLTSYAGL